MDQITFSDLEYQHKKRKTRRQKFLEKMELLIPWEKLEKKVRRHYPKAGRGRHPYPLAVMLRIHCVQLFYNLSDPAMEDMLYEIDSVRRFVGLKITGPIPDESTILKFRHLLESHGLGTKLFEVINQHLADQGLMLKEGTIVDASIISAPSSTKNRSGTRDPEMHQAKKGNEWHFGMKMHIGVDDELGLTHSLSTSAANVSDVTQAAKLLHGDELRVCGDSGYQGVDKRPEHEGREVEWKIAMRPGKRAVLAPGSLAGRAERKKASIRAKVEHPFREVVHHLFCKLIGLLLMRWSWWARGSRVWSSGGKVALHFSTACPHGPPGANRSVRTRPQIHRIRPRHGKGLKASGYPYVISLKVTMRGVPEWPSRARIALGTAPWNC